MDVSVRSLSSKLAFFQFYLFCRAANGQTESAEVKPGKYSKKYRDTKDELTNRDENGGLKFVYPYGATINVRKPSYAILSSGPISFPANRPVGAFYMSLKRGKLFILGSIQFFNDDFFEKEDNQKI
jgi:intraflagellar transport protein 52